MVELNTEQRQKKKEEEREITWMNEETEIKTKGQTGPVSRGFMSR